MTYVAQGEFSRDKNYISTRITADGRDGFPVEAGRYRLVVSRACPWANRAIIVRRLLGLEGALSMGVAGPTHDARSWTFDLDPGGRDPVLGIERLQERSEEHTSELQSLMRISYAVFCLKKKNNEDTYQNKHKLLLHTP